MAQRIEDLYNELAIITGFPLYTNTTDTPDTNRLLFHVMTQALQNLIDNLYTDNNVLKRTDVITTEPNNDIYGIDGLIKNCQLIEDSGKVIQLPYNDKFNPDADVDHSILKVNTTEVTITTDTTTDVDTDEDVDTEEETDESLIERRNTGKPTSYCIRNGYLRLLPMPDKAYKIKLTLSTTDLIWADDNQAKNYIDSVEDIILADRRFCDLIVLRAAAMIFMRAQNANAQFYMDLCQQRLATYIEHDNRTMEAQRGFIRRAGHYDPRRGLLG